MTGPTTPRLEPRTEAGRRFADAAESQVPALRARAAQADRDQRMQEANFRGLVDCGIATAFVPRELGGLGLESVHDWMAGVAALARGDASTAIAINMHLGVSRGLALAAARRNAVPNRWLRSPRGRC